MTNVLLNQQHAAYYNENDPAAAAWLRELIAAGFIAPGEVDERSIADVRADDITGFRQCHWFAGVGGWSYALRLAGWPDNRPVWTGSCPCQPFSAAGKRKGAADERHLWPVWFELIRECRPVTVFGEQVASAVGHGWLDGVSADLEAEGYACGAVVLGAHSVGAPHIRQRLWWVADAHCGHAGATWVQRGGQYGQLSENGGAASGLEHPARDGRQQRRTKSGGRGAADGCGTGGLGVTNRSGRDTRKQAAETMGYGDTTKPTGGARDPWSHAVWLPCADGKARRIGADIEPLAYGVPGRVGLLRGYGNAIVPQAAAEFIGAYLNQQHADFSQRGE